MELTASLINSGVDLKFFPEVPAERDAVNRVLGYSITHILEAISSDPLVHNLAHFLIFLIQGPCPEENANIFSKLTFWWLNG